MPDCRADTKDYKQRLLEYSVLICDADVTTSDVGCGLLLNMLPVKLVREFVISSAVDQDVLATIRPTLCNNRKITA